MNNYNTRAKLMRVFFAMIFFGCLFIAPLLFAQQSTSGDIGKEKFIYPEDAIKDPFVSILDTTGGVRDEGPTSQELFDMKLKKLLVNGVFWDAYSPLAMINNELYKTGDIVIEGVSVLEIKEDFVMFGYQGLKKKISLIEEKHYN
ncbi:MAG: hypothetical protein ABII75_07555 [Candidatus Omnitrophota bacterium]